MTLNVMVLENEPDAAADADAVSCGTRDTRCCRATIRRRRRSRAGASWIPRACPLRSHAVDVALGGSRRRRARSPRWAKTAPAAHSCTASRSSSPARRCSIRSTTSPPARSRPPMTSSRLARKPRRRRSSRPGPRASARSRAGAAEAAGVARDTARRAPARPHVARRTPDAAGALDRGRVASSRRCARSTRTRQESTSRSTPEPDDGTVRGSESTRCSRSGRATSCSPTARPCTCGRCMPTTSRGSQRMYERLSADSVYFRFFSPVPRPTATTLEMRTLGDAGHVARVALLGDEIVGRRAVRRRPPGRGGGRVRRRRRASGPRRRHVVARAPRGHCPLRTGIHTFAADTLSDNAKMLGVFAAAGWDRASRIRRVRRCAPSSRSSRARRRPPRSPIVSTLPRRRRWRGCSSRRAVAVIGASREPGKIGNAVMQNLARRGLRGPSLSGQPERGVGRRVSPRTRRCSTFPVRSTSPSSCGRRPRCSASSTSARASRCTRS